MDLRSRSFLTQLQACNWVIVDSLWNGTKVIDSNLEGNRWYLWAVWHQNSNTKKTSSCMPSDFQWKIQPDLWQQNTECAWFGWNIQILASEDEQTGMGVKLRVPVNIARCRTLIMYAIPPSHGHEQELLVHDSITRCCPCMYAGISLRIQHMNWFVESSLMAYSRALAFFSVPIIWLQLVAVNAFFSGLLCFWLDVWHFHCMSVYVLGMTSYIISSYSSMHIPSIVWILVHSKHALLASLNVWRWPLYRSILVFIYKMQHQAMPSASLGDVCQYSGVLRKLYMNCLDFCSFI